MTNAENSLECTLHLKFVYLVKLQSNRSATLSPENLENTSTSESWRMTLVAYKKSVIKLFERFRAESMVFCCPNAFDPS